MKLHRVVPLTLLVLLALAAEALAANVGRKDDWYAGVAGLPASLLLVALPLAVLARATLSLPGKIAVVLEEKPFACLLLGAANLLLVTLIAGAAGQLRVVKWIVLALVIAYLVAAFLGMTGNAARLGRRLYRNEEKGDGVGAFTLGWLILAGVPLFPVLGLFVLLWFLAKGVGAVILAVFR